MNNKSLEELKNKKLENLLRAMDCLDLAGIATDLNELNSCLLKMITLKKGDVMDCFLTEEAEQPLYSQMQRLKAVEALRKNYELLIKIAEVPLE